MAKTNITEEQPSIAKVSTEALVLSTGLPSKSREKLHTTTPRINSMLATNIAAKKDPTLFDLLEDKDRIELEAVDNAHYIDRRNKPVYLTNKQTKIIAALSYVITQFLDDEDVKDYVEALRRTEKPRHRVARVLSLKELSKLLNRGSSRTREVEDLRTELKNLSEIKQIQTIRVGRDPKDSVTIVRPLINIGDQMIDNSPDKRLGADAVEIIFSNIFFNGVTQSFSKLTPRLFDVWGQKKNGTDTLLFSILWADLSAKFPQYLGKARDAARNVKVENSKMSKGNLQALINSKVRETLIYPQSTALIRDRVPTDYETTRKMKAKYLPDLQKALDALIEIGIITNESHITPIKDKVIFFFNKDFGLKEGERRSLSD